MAWDTNTEDSGASTQGPEHHQLVPIQYKGGGSTVKGIQRVWFGGGRKRDLYLVFILIFLYKRIWAFMGQIMLTRSKGSWANLSLSAEAILPKNCILWQICILLQICNLLQIYVLLYIVFPCTSFFGPFWLFGLLGGSLGLDFYWSFFLMGFWIWIRKNRHQQFLYILH